MVNRSADRAHACVALAGDRGRVVGAEAVAEADLVVNATPVGMGDDAGLPADPAALLDHAVVADLVYHPRRTPLLAAAEDRGLATVGGLGMLVHQAARQFRTWTGHEPPLEAMRAAADAP